MALLALFLYSQSQNLWQRVTVDNIRIVHTLSFGEVRFVTKLFSLRGVSNIYEAN
jgi:hypothetical protein